MHCGSAKTVWVPRPRSFAGLMALYDSNWQLFTLLVPGLVRLDDGPQVSRVSGDCAVHLQVLQRSRHTTTVAMTYLFDDGTGAGGQADPDLTLRVYHDARQVEVLAGGVHRHAWLKRLSQQFAELDRRWHLNLLLNKWLEYLLDRGHLFTGLANQRAAGGPACAASRFVRGG